MEITIKLTSLTQATALQRALELYIDMETDRSKDGADADFKKSDAELLAAARKVMRSITEGK